jgi:Arc/MetJ-type ribon-helix-helix transcriptional regulator
MNIEIHKPEVERRVREGIKSGRFHDVDELLTKALDALSEKEASPPHSGAALVEAMQTSPYKEIDLQPRRDRLPEYGASTKGTRMPS